MRVILRSTGQMGDIPDDKFDPKLFESVARPQQTVQQPQQNGGFTGLGGGLLNFLLPATSRLMGTDQGKIVSPAQVPIGSNEFTRPQFQEKPAKAAAEILSYLMPFGKGAGLAQKALLPGAAVGALQGLSQENVTPQSVIGGAALGAGGAGILEGILGKAGALFGGKSQAVEQIGKDISASVRKIRTKPGIYGAEIEKGINKTLDTFGFKGTPQQQYERLAPAMNELEGNIQQFIKNNPSISVAKEDIKKSFLTNLQSALRSKEMTEGQAIKEVNGYLNDLLKASGGTGKFTDISLQKLRDLKKLVNNDYGPVQRLIETNGTLNARQKVIAEAWKSLDEAVKSAAPEVKDLLKHESNLYRAAPSLSTARFNAPTQRLFGTSIPGAVTQAATDIAGRGVQGIARGAEIAGQGAKNPLLEYLVRQTGARLPLNIGQNVQNENYTSDNQGIQNQPTGNLNQILPPSESVQQPTNGMQITPQILTQARLILPEKEYKKVKDIYDLQQGPKQKPLPTAAQTQVNLAKSGIRGLDDAEQILQKKGINQTLGLQKIPGQLFTREYDASMFRAIESLLRSRSGAAVPETEVRRYMSRFAPRFGDNVQTVQYKLINLRKDFEDMASIANQPSQSNNSDLLLQMLQQTQ